MTEDISYCSSSYLMYRTIVNEEKCFSLDNKVFRMPYPNPRIPIHSSKELAAHLKESIALKTKGKKVGLALSGGIDSAILLQYMPEDTIAYTFKCVVPGKKVVDETEGANRYLEYARPNMQHKIVEITWNDMETMIVPLMLHKGSPTHSIEVQIYKAALQAKADGCDIFIFGETADCIYGGHSMLLSKDWTKEEFIDRWCFVDPNKVLKNPEIDLSPFDQFIDSNGNADVPKFLTCFESYPSFNFYANACAVAGIEFFAPYANTIMAHPLDLVRVRNGENKYLVREVFSMLYPNFNIPGKVPMPRPMNEWMADWSGPVSDDFRQDIDLGTMSGDQKWLLWCLDKYLSIIRKPTEHVSTAQANI